MAHSHIVNFFCLFSLVAPSARPASPTGLVPSREGDVSQQGCPLETAGTYYSQSNEDKAIYERYFSSPPKCGGVVLETGAFDGVTYSNSKFFEDHLNWTSILIEPNEANYAALSQSRGSSPRAELHHAAVCPGESVTFEGSEATGGMSDSMDAAHRSKWGSQAYSVPCTTLAKALEGHSYVDAAFIDVEGGELVVLQTMNWAIKVGVWVVELDGGNETKDEAVRSLLRSHGYRQVTEWSLKEWCTPGADCTTNDVWVPENDEAVPKAMATGARSAV